MTKIRMACIVDYSPNIRFLVSVAKSEVHRADKKTGRPANHGATRFEVWSLTGIYSLALKAVPAAIRSRELVTRTVDVVSST